MRFSSPISCITPLDARQEAHPPVVAATHIAHHWLAESCIWQSDVRTPRTQARDKLGAPAAAAVRFSPRSAERARGSRKKPSTVRGERAARRVSVDTPQ